MSPLSILEIVSQASSLIGSGDNEGCLEVLATLGGQQMSRGHKLGSRILMDAVRQLIADGDAPGAKSLIDQYTAADMLPYRKSGYGSHGCKCGYHFGVELEMWRCPECNEPRKLFRVNQDTTGYHDALAIVAHHNLEVCRAYLLEMIGERDEAAVKSMYKRYAELVSDHSDSRYQGVWFREAMGFFLRHERWDGMVTAVEDLSSSINHHRFQKICGRKLSNCQGDACGYKFPGNSTDWICPECGAIRRVCQITGLKLKDDGFCSLHSRYRTAQTTAFQFSSPRLQDIYERQTMLPDITDTTRYIELANVRIQSLAESMSGVDINAGLRIMEQIGDLVYQSEAGVTINDEEFRDKLRGLQRIMGAAIGDTKAWQDIMDTTEQARRHAETIVKQQVAEQQVVTMQVYTQSLVFMAQAVVQILESRLDDPDLVYDIRMRLADRAESLMSLDFIEGQVER